MYVSTSLYKTFCASKVKHRKPNKKRDVEKEKKDFITVGAAKHGA